MILTQRDAIDFVCLFKTVLGGLGNLRAFGTFRPWRRGRWRRVSLMTAILAEVLPFITAVDSRNSFSTNGAHHSFMFVLFLVFHDEMDIISHLILIVVFYQIIKVKGLI